MNRPRYDIFIFDGTKQLPSKFFTTENITPFGGQFTSEQTAQTLYNHRNQDFIMGYDYKKDRKFFLTGVDYSAW